MLAVLILTGSLLTTITLHYYSNSVRDLSQCNCRTELELSKAHIPRALCKQ